jgi:hypothetical protein
MYDAWREINHIVQRMDQHEWLMVMAVIVAVGLFCLRGFGSRKNY